MTDNGNGVANIYKDWKDLEVKKCRFGYLFCFSCASYWELVSANAPSDLCYMRGAHKRHKSCTSLLLSLLQIGCLNFQTLPLADVVMITSTASVFTVFQARLFLKEPIRPVDMINVALVLCGIVLISQPKFLFGSYGYSYRYRISCNDSFGKWHIYVWTLDWVLHARVEVAVETRE